MLDPPTPLPPAPSPHPPPPTPLPPPPPPPLNWREKPLYGPAAQAKHALDLAEAANQSAAADRAREDQDGVVCWIVG